MCDQNQRLAKRLASLREESNLSVEVAAANTGIARDDILMFESGATRPTAQQLDDLATLYGVTVYTLVFRSIPQTGTGKLVVPPVAAIGYGIGKSEEESRANLEQSRVDELPYFDITMPDDVSVEELRAIVEECSSAIGHAAVLLQSALRAIRSDVIPKEIVRRMRRAIRDIMVARRIVDNAMD